MENDCVSPECAALVEFGRRVIGAISAFGAFRAIRVLRAYGISHDIYLGDKACLSPSMIRARSDDSPKALKYGSNWKVKISRRRGARW